MIEAQTRPAHTSFVARLTARAVAIARARAELRRSSDPARWRSPRLLWPLFTKGR